MYFGKKNITKNLAVSKEVANIAMRTSCEYTATNYILVSCSKKFGRSLVAHLHSCSRGWFAKQRGCALFLYPYINQIFDLQCEPASRICSRRKVRRAQTYSLRNRLLLLTSSRSVSLWNSLTDILRNLSLLRAFTAVRFRLLASGATTSSKVATPRCTNSPLNLKPSNLSIVSDNRPLIPVPA